MELLCNCSSFNVNFIFNLLRVRSVEKKKKKINGNQNKFILKLIHNIYPYTDIYVNNTNIFVFLRNYNFRFDASQWK